MIEAEVSEQPLCTGLRIGFVFTHNGLVFEGCGPCLLVVTWLWTVQNMSCCATQ